MCEPCKLHQQIVLANDSVSVGSGSNVFIVFVPLCLCGESNYRSSATMRGGFYHKDAKTQRALLLNDRHDSQRPAAAAANLHRQRNHDEIFSGQRAHIPDVLKRRNVFREQNLMTLEQC